MTLWVVVFSLSLRYLFLSNDVGIVHSALMLPILEPLTPQHLQQIAACTLTCLYAAVTVATADTILNMVKPVTSAQQLSKEEETDAHGCDIVTKAVSMMGNVLLIYVYSGNSTF